MAHLNITILGLNRISASMGLALKRFTKKGGKHSFTITGYDSTSDNLKVAKKMGAVEKTENRIENAVKEADVVVMAVSYDETEYAYRDIRTSLRDGVVILDLSPLKQPSLAWSKTHLTPEHHVIGITATVNARYLFDTRKILDGAEEDLFDESTILLTPAASSAEEAVDLAFNFATIIGGKPRFLDPVEHDLLLAQTEQLPRLLGVMLFYDLMNKSNWDDLQWLTNPDFGALTRPLFDVHPDALRDEFHGNREPLARVLDGYINTLTQIRDALSDGDRETVETVAIDASTVYENWINSRYKADWDAAARPIDATRAVGGSMLEGLLGSTLAGKITGKNDDR